MPMENQQSASADIQAITTEFREYVYLLKDNADGNAIRRAIKFSIIRKQYENTLIIQANFDNLTGLANRMLFENRLDMAMARMKRDGGGLGVLFLDLNRFKRVNDTLGHAAGDRLLIEIGKRLTQCLRPYDTVARFGGDEFAMLIEGMADAGRCAAVAQKIITLCEHPFVTSGTTIYVGASIGIATFAAGGNQSREELMQQADAAMYEAKAAPESAYRFFSSNSKPHLPSLPRMRA
jgi:diguanylate cyclase (GGDEF)-like protein